MSFTARIDADISGFEQSLNDASRLVKDFEDKIKQSTDGVRFLGERISDFGDKISGLGKKLSVLSAGLVAVGGKAYIMAAEFNDAMGATDQIFKEASESVKVWASDLETYYGVAKGEAVEYANLMGTMLQNIGGMTEKLAGETAGRLVELAGDLTAMYGGRTQDAVRALTGALKGNNTMLDNYGMAVNDALVKTKAFEMGLYAGKGDIDLKAKQLATLSIIFEQTATSQGQAAREADSASGAIRTLQTEVKNLTTELGEILLPVITPIIEKITSLVAKFREMSPEMQRVVVVSSAIAASLGPVLIVVGKLITVFGGLLPALTTAGGLITKLTVLAPGLIVGLKGIAASFAAIAAPVATAVAAIIGAVALIRSNWDKIVEYFTVGDGAEMFNTVKELALELKSQLSYIWNETVGFLRAVWDRFGKYIVSITGTAFKNVIKAIDIALNIVLGVVSTVTSLLKLDFKEAWQALTTMTSRVWEGLVSIVQNAVSGILTSVAGMLDFFGLNGLSQKMLDFAESIKPPKIEPIEIEIPNETNNNVKELGSNIQELNDEFDNLATSAEKAGKKVGESVARAKVNLRNLKKIAQPKQKDVEIKPLQVQIDLEVKDTHLFDKWADEEFGKKINSYLQDAIGNVAATVGSAIAEGQNVIQAAGLSLLSSLGAILIDLGKMTMATGRAIKAVKDALKTLNPWAALAVGAGLIAIGSLFAAGASKLGNSMGKGSSYGASSSPSINTQLTPVTPNYRGAYQDEVVFKIGTNELVGVLKDADLRKNRL